MKESVNNWSMCLDTMVCQTRRKYKNRQSEKEKQQEKEKYMNILIDTNEKYKDEYVSWLHNHLGKRRRDEYEWATWIVWMNASNKNST